MNSFDLQAHLDKVYAKYPEADQKPVIGITGNYEDLTCKLGKGYYQSVVEAGGVPMVIPPVADTDVIILLQLFYVALSLLSNLIIDIVYGLVDPRVRVNA